MLKQQGYIKAFEDPNKEKSYPSEFKATIIFVDGDVHEEFIPAYTFEDAFEVLMGNFIEKNRAAKSIMLDLFR